MRSPRATSRITKIVLVIALIGQGISTVPAEAASGGTWKARVIHNQNLLSVSFPTSTHGWVVGEQGSILRTTDGGQSWTTQKSGTKVPLRGVEFVSPTQGWAVGESDTVLSTIDGGVSWTKTSTGTGAHLTAVDFVDDRYGWAVGTIGSTVRCCTPVIVTTSDAGRTWTKQDQLPTGFDVTAVSFYGRRSGFAVGGSNSALRTEDGGESWIPMVVSGDEIAGYRDVVQTSPSEGLIVGVASRGTTGAEPGRIWRTTDAGQTWTLVAQVGKPLNSVATFGDSAFAVGEVGAAFRSEDSGSTWSLEASGTTTDFRGVAAPQAGSAIAIGTGILTPLGGISIYTADPDEAPPPVPYDLRPAADTCQGLKVAWKNDAAGPPSGAIGVKTSIGDIVILVGQEGLRAIKPFLPTDQATLWQTPIRAVFQEVIEAELDADPATKELVAVTFDTSGARDGVVAVRAETGDVLWSTKLPQAGAGARVVATDLDQDSIEDVIVMGTSLTNALFTLSGIDGSRLRPPRALGAAGNDIGTGEMTGDATADIAVGLDDGRVIVVNGSTGALAWTYKTTWVTAFDSTIKSIALRDLNGDGVADVVAGGQGLPRSHGSAGASGRQPIIEAIDGSNGKLMWDYSHYSQFFSTVTSVAIGQITAEGGPDVVAVVDGGSRGAVVALEGRGRTVAGHPTGEPMTLWAHSLRHPSGGKGYGTNSPDSLVLGDGNVDGSADAYVGFTSGHMVAISGAGTEPVVSPPLRTFLDGPDSRLLWEYARSAKQRVPSFLDIGNVPSLLTLASDNLVSLRDPLTGQQRWSYDAGGAPVVATADFDGDPASEVAVGGTSGRVYALDSNGEAIGPSEDFLPQRVVSVASVQADDDATLELVAVSLDGTVRVTEPLTGEVLWSEHVPEASRAAFGDGVVVVGTFTGALVALDANNGEQIWELGSSTGGGVSGLLFSSQGHTFAVGDYAGGIRIVSPAGNLVGSGQARDSIHDLALADVDGNRAEDVVVGAGRFSLFAPGRGSIEVFGPAGTKRWSNFYPDGPVFGVGTGDLDGDGAHDVFGQAFDNNAYGLRGSTGAQLWAVENGEPGPAAASLDVDGDGKDEAVFGRHGHPGFRMIAVSGDGSVKGVCTPAKGPVEMVPADVDADGNNELVVGMDQGDIYLLGTETYRAPKSDPTPAPTEEPDPTPTPSISAFPETRLYFHSAGSPTNTSDLVLNDGATFDASPPTSSEAAVATETSLLINRGRGGGGDPVWRGTLPGTVRSLTVDFWQKAPAGEFVGSKAHYYVKVLVGKDEVKKIFLPPLEAPAPLGVAATRITHTFTTMLDDDGIREIPMSITAGDLPVEFALSGRYGVEEAAAAILYDSTQYPSGFVVGIGPSPSPEVTLTPTSSPTPPPPPDTACKTYPEEPNDSYFGGASPKGFTPQQWGLRVIEATKAWQKPHSTGCGIKVAVLDTGVDITDDSNKVHPDFACDNKIHIVPGSDIVGRDSDPDDENGHGTHVAGIIGACTDNGIGVAGIAPDSTIVPIRVLNAQGIGGDAQFIAGLDKAIEAGVHVVNMSLSYGQGKEIINDVTGVDEALRRARSAGIVVIAAAGNDSLPLCNYPSLAEDVVCVGATDPRDVRTWYSNGASKLYEPGDFEHTVVAPGGTETIVFCDVYQENMLSTYSREHDDAKCSIDNGYQTVNGTSMAAPHVAGVAALVYDRLNGIRSRENVQAVITALTSTALDLGPPGDDGVYGSGRVDALAAVESVPVTPRDADPTETPTESPSSSVSPSPSESNTARETQLTFTERSAEATQYSDEPLFEAHLSSDGAPLAGQELVFELTGPEGSSAFPAVTDDQGLGSVTPVLEERPGTYELTVRYAGNEDAYEGSADSMAIVIEREDTASTLRIEGRGDDKSLVARLADADTDASGIGARTIEFFSDGTPIGTATTGDDGVARLLIPAGHRGNKRVYEARFAGDSFYLGSSATASSGKPKNAV